MKKILPPARPNRTENRRKIERVLETFAIRKDRASLVFVRGYFLDSMGEKGKDDRNIYDDACFLYTPTIFESYNANTNPSVAIRNGKALAELITGQYKFYRGKHRGRYKALRTFPEGAVLECMRNGEISSCSHINIHKGSTNPRASDIVWSEGCLTIPDIQYPDWQVRLWTAMDSLGQKVIDVVLLENRPTKDGQRWFLANEPII